MAQEPHLQQIKQQKFPEGYKWVVMGIVMLGMIMAAIDQSIVNVSIPKIMADFGVNLDDIEWVSTGYMLAFATLMPMTGWLRDRIGYRNIYIGALFLFTLGSVLCGLAWNLPMLIFARVIQAFGGGAMQPTSMAMAAEVFPPEERGSSMGVFGVAIIIGPAFGPTLGGFLTDYFGWRSIFFVNLPLGIIGIVAAMELLLKDAPHKLVKKPFDFWGFGFLSVFLVFALLGLSKGQREGWSSAFIITCFSLAAIGFIGFMLVDSYIDYPIIDLSLFKIPVFASATAITVARSAGLFGSIFLIPVFVQQQMGYTALQSGMLMLPSALFMGIVLPLVGIMSDRIGPRIPCTIGVLIVAYSLLVYDKLDVNTGIWGMIYPMMLRSIGMGLLMAPVMLAFMNSVPQRKIGIASSMNSIIQQVGASIGIAFFTAILSNRSVFHIAMAGQNIKASNPAFRQSLENIMAHVHELGYGFGTSMLASRGMLMGAIVKSGVIKAFQDTFFIAALVVMIAVPLALMLPANVVRQPHTHGPKRGKTKEESLDIVID